MKKLLIVVDYQNDFVDGSLGSSQAKAIETALCNKINEYKQNGDTVIFTLDTHRENYLETAEGKRLPVKHCIKCSDGHAIHGEVADALKGCFAIEKESFGSKSLYIYLSGHKFDYIELCGVVTNICVISNAAIAKTASPESEVVVDATCVASNDDVLNEKALDVMESMQISILNR